MLCPICGSCLIEHDGQRHGSASATISAHRASWRTSWVAKVAVPPASTISFSIALPSVALLSVRTTEAPCRANSLAVAAPMPDAPPVTSATLPISLFPGCMPASTVQASPEADLAQDDDTVHRVAARNTSWRLSRREDQILSCLAQGQSNKLIARSCGVADATIKVHMKSIFRKMGVGNRTQAALRTIERAADMAVDLVPSYSNPPAVETV
jgi:DNA-binding CsgD family transcriptional regulator